MVAIKSFVASVLLALLFVPAVLADNYTVKLVADDQHWADQTLMTPGDFGFGWHGGTTRTAKPAGISCPGFDPKASDLVVTGYANASFEYRNAGIHVDQALLVLSSTAAVQKDFSRTIEPQLPGCLEYQLKRSSPHVTTVKVEPLAFPRVGNVSAAYRATVTVQVKGGTVKFLRDFVFISNGRQELSLTVDAPASYRQRLVPWEADMARILVKRGARPQ